jgi:hypothetical protein
MAGVDFLTNVETAFLTLLAANPLLAEYNWQRGTSDKQVELPRGVLGLRSQRDPDESPYYRIDVLIKLEGRPKKQEMAAIRNELVELLETTEPSDLSDASKGTVAFIGRAIRVVEENPIVEGLRTRTLGFMIYAVPMV